MKILHHVFILALLASASEAFALQKSEPTPPAAQAAQKTAQLTPEQQAQIARQDAEIAKAAVQAVQLVDQNRIGEVWDGVSVVARGVVSRESFVQQIASDRRKLGAIGARKQVAITHAVFEADAKVPPGNYINVVFATRFANAPKAVRELVSFHLDEDKTWRVSGYSLR